MDNNNEKPAEIPATEPPQPVAGRSGQGTASIVPYLQRQLQPQIPAEIELPESPEDPASS